MFLKFLININIVDGLDVKQFSQTNYRYMPDQSNLPCINTYKTHRSFHIRRKASYNCLDSLKQNLQEHNYL